MLSRSPTPPSHDQGGSSSHPSDKIRVVIADDHPVYREGLTLAINSNPDLIVVGEAGDGRQLLQMVRQVQPDVVLSDIKMPDIDGVQAVAEILSINPGIRCILISQYDNDRFITDAIAAGATGYLVKKATKDEISEAIRSVAAYRPYFCRFASAKLGRLISKSIYHVVPHPSGPAFTDKEKEIISLLCEEKSSEEIGKLLFLSGRTVEGYKAKIMNKIGVNTTVGIVIYAIRHGFYNINES